MAVLRDSFMTVSLSYVHPDAVPLVPRPHFPSQQPLLGLVSFCLLGVG